VEVREDARVEKTSLLVVYHVASDTEMLLRGSSAAEVRHWRCQLQEIQTHRRAAMARAAALEAERAAAAAAAAAAEHLAAAEQHALTLPATVAAEVTARASRAHNMPLHRIASLRLIAAAADAQHSVIAAEASNLLRVPSAEIERWQALATTKTAKAEQAEQMELAEPSSKVEVEADAAPRRTVSWAQADVASADAPKGALGEALKGTEGTKKEKAEAVPTAKVQAAANTTAKKEAAVKAKAKQAVDAKAANEAAGGARAAAEARKSKAGASLSSAAAGASDDDAQKLGAAAVVAFQAVFGAQTQPVMSGVYGGGVGGSAAEELGVVGESAAADVISEAEAKALVMATDPHKRAVADHPNWGMMSWTARLALCRAANDGTACTTAPEEAGAASVDAPKGKEGTKKEKAEAAVAAKAQKAADVAAKKEKAVQAKAKKAADAKAVKEAAGKAKAAAKEARKSKARASLSSAAAGAAGSVVRTPVRVEAGEMEQLRLSDRLRV
jgi:hypothetical protein